MPARTVRASAPVYLLLLVMQTLAAMIVLWCMVPMYRAIWAALGQQMDHLPSSPAIMVMALILFHCVYWYRLARVPLVVNWQNMFVSHLVLFLGRLCFIFATAFFALVIFRHLPAMSLVRDPILLVMRIAATFAVLFTIYCYTVELERIGTALRPPTP